MAFYSTFIPLAQKHFLMILLFETALYAAMQPNEDSTPILRPGGNPSETACASS